MVPVRFMLSTFTDSPSLKSVGLYSFFGFCTFKDEDAVFSFIFLRRRSLSFSISAAEIFSFPNLRKFLIVSSATSLASRRIVFAFSRASARIRSLCSSMRSCFCCAWLFSASISFLYAAISSCSFSIVRLLVSRSEIRSSNETSCSESLVLASSMI